MRRRINPAEMPRARDTSRRRRCAGLVNVWLVVGWLLAASLASAQRLPFVSFSGRDGLAHSIVFSLAQSPDGFMWVGTASGLTRYDGQEMITFDEGTGLTSNVVRSLLAHSDGSLWIGGEAGVMRMRGMDLDYPVPLLDGLPIRSLLEDDDGGVWIATYDGGLVHWKAQRVERFGSEEGISAERLRSLARGHDGSIWLGSYGQGIFRLRDGSVQHFAEDEGVSDLHVRSMLVLSNGDVLAGTGTGVVVFDGTGFVPYGPAEGLDGSRVTCMIEDERRNLWIGTRTRGLCRVDPVACFTTEQGLGADSVIALAIDREANLWIGTYGGGMSRLVSDQVMIIDQTTGLPGVQVQGFTEVGDDVLIGVHSRGLVPFGHSLRADEVLAPGTTVLGLMAVDDTVWVGTLSGALRLRDGEVRLIGPTTPVYQVEPNPAGGVWLATFDGLIAWQEGSQRILTVADGLPNNRVNTLLKTSAGLWAGTTGGVALIVDEQVVQVLDASTGLTEVWVEAMAEGPDGSLWLASSPRLHRWADGRFTSFGVEQGLSHRKCTSLVFDRLGRLWVGTSGGIDIYDGTKFSSFTSGMGLPSIETASNAAYLDRQGRVWFGTFGGALVFDEGVTPKLPAPPLLGLGEVSIDDDAVEIQSLLDLGHDQNRISIKLRPIALTFPEDVEISYRLTGLESSYRSVQHPEIEYSAIPPGRFIFTARARQRGGPWSESVEIPINIAPPLWETWWFRTLFLAMAVLSAIAAHRLRSRSIRLHNEHLESLVLERTEELRTQRQEVERRVEQLSLITTMVQRINAEPDLQGLLRVILDEVCDRHLAMSGIALRHNPEAGAFEIQTARGPSITDLTIHQAEFDDLIETSDQVSEGLFFLARRPPLQCEWPLSTLIVVLELGNHPAAVLLFGGAWQSIHQIDLETFRQLGVHLESAVQKGRSMEQLATVNKAKDEFLGIAAHDLRNPLGGVKSFTDLLLRQLTEGRVDHDRWHRYLTNIRISADHMQRLIEDLLDVATIQTGRVRLSLGPVSVDDVVAERVEMLRPQAEAKGIGVLVSLPPKPLTVQADRHRLSEILDNLLSNAIKYSSKGDQVSVDWHLVGNDVVLVNVNDTGQGFTEADLTKIFSGGKLSARPTAGESSTGLGLVIVKKLVEAQGGRIDCSSTHGQGSSFTVALPAVFPDDLSAAW